MLASLQNLLHSVFAVSTFQSQNDLLGSLGLSSQDGLGLSSVSLLLGIVATLSLGEQ